MRQVDGFALVEVVGERDLAGRLVPDTSVRQARDGGRSLDRHDGVGHFSRQRHISGHGDDPHQRGIHREVHLDTHAGVRIEGLESTHEGQAAIARSGDLERALLRGNNLEEGAGLSDERIDLQYHSRAIRLIDFGREGLDRLVTVVQLESALELGGSVTAVDDGVGSLHHDGAVLLLEAEDDGSGVHRADSEVIGISR